MGIEPRFGAPSKVFLGQGLRWRMPDVHETASTRNHQGRGPSRPLAGSGDGDGPPVGPHPGGRHGQSWPVSRMSSSPNRLPPAAPSPAERQRQTRPLTRISPNRLGWLILNPPVVHFSYRPQSSYQRIPPLDGRPRHGALRWIGLLPDSFCDYRPHRVGGRRQGAGPAGRRRVETPNL